MVSEVREIENEGEISGRTPNPKTKLWDWQQNFSGLLIIYVPYIKKSLQMRDFPWEGK